MTAKYGLKPSNNKGDIQGRYAAAARKLRRKQITENKYNIIIFINVPNLLNKFLNLIKDGQALIKSLIQNRCNECQRSSSTSYDVCGFLNKQGQKVFWSPSARPSDTSSALEITKV